MTKAKTGHVVGIDPMTDRIVVLRKGMDGKTVRQVDVLTRSEAQLLRDGLFDALQASEPRASVPSITPTPEPEQTMLDLDSLTRKEPTA